MSTLLPGDAVLLARAEALLRVLGARGLRLATAESCTGGLIAATLTAIPGASAPFAGGFVVYENALKSRLLGVTKTLLARHGAVSAEVAAAMAEGVRRRTRTDLGLAVTGIAGPGGGSAAKPVGLVFIALADPGTVRVERWMFPGDRAAIRAAAVRAGLALVRAGLEPGAGEPISDGD